MMFKNCMWRLFKQSVFKQSVLLYSAMLLACFEALPAYAQSHDEQSELEAVRNLCLATPLARFRCHYNAGKIWEGALLGNAQRQFQLAELYRIGWHTHSTRFTSAERWYLRAAKQNYAHAQFRLHEFYETGKADTPINKPKSVYWLLRSADLNFRPAIEARDKLLNKRKNRTQAFAPIVIDHITRMAHSGSPQAQFDLGLALHRGNGVKRNRESAFKWMLKAAKQNHAQSQVNVGLQYYYGNVVQKDADQAYLWIKKAADQNLSHAQHLIGLMYADGDILEKDVLLAIPLLEEAAENGAYSAYFKLASLYEKGDGVPANSEKAKELKRAGQAQFLMDESDQLLVGY